MIYHLILEWRWIVLLQGYKLMQWVRGMLRDSLGSLSMMRDSYLWNHIHWTKRHNFLRLVLLGWLILHRKSEQVYQQNWWHMVNQRVVILIELPKQLQILVSLSCLLRQPMMMRNLIHKLLVEHRLKLWYLDPFILVVPSPCFEWILGNLTIL